MYETTKDAFYFESFNKFYVLNHWLVGGSNFRVI